MSYKVVFMRKSAAARAMAHAESRDRYSLRAWVLSTFFFVILALMASSAVAQSFRFTSIEIEGNNRIEFGTILAQAGIAENQSLSAAELNDAYQALVASGLFESVEISPSGSRLKIVVVERPTINRITFEGNSKIKSNVLTELVSSQQGRVFNPLAVERDASAITAAYSEKGRIAASITPKIIRRSDNRVDLVFEIVEGGRVEVERLSFVGNAQFSDARLRRILETKQAGIFRFLVQRDTFVSDRVAFDRRVLTDFYQSRGYVDFRVLDVETELTRDRGSYFLTFIVEEGQQFDFGNVSVRSEYPGVGADEYAKILRIKSGDLYSPTDIDNEIARLEILATDNQLDFLRVEPVVTRNAEDLTLDVELVLKRGDRVFIERIDIEGNTSTLDKVIRRQFDAVEGDPFNPREIREAANRIRALRFFATDDVSARAGSASDKMVIDVSLQERATGNVSFGGNYNTASGISAVATYKETNFLGRGQALDFSFQKGESNTRFSFDFAEPALMGQNTRFGLSMGRFQTDNENALYDTAITSFSPSLGFAIADDARLNLRYRLAAEDLTDVDGSASAVVVNEALAGQLTTSALGYALTYDNRSSGLNPDAGILVRLDQEYAGVGGDNNYLKTSAQATAQTTIVDDRITLKATLEGGLLNYATGNSRVTDRFFMGSQVMRGFAPNGIGPRDDTTGDALGGNRFAVARLEAQFPLGLPEEYGITGGVFYDAGSLWDVGETFGETINYNDFTLRQVVGASIFWDTPIGPLRFNWTEALSKQTGDIEQGFELTVSAEF
jgi:outer membrane protein insertion porin family